MFGGAEHRYGRIISPSYTANWLVRVPETVVPEEIIVNSYARDILDPKHKYLATSDFLRENCFLTSAWSVMPENNKGDVLVYAVPEWTRGVPLWGFTGKDRVWFGDFPGGVYMVKGIGASGRHYGMSYISSYDDPWGLFGDTDALKEKDFGNRLLMHGGRSSLVTGYVVFNNEEIRELYEHYNRLWRNDPVLRNIYLKQIDKITRNGDRITIMHRIAGTRLRLDDKYTNDVYDKKRLFVEGAPLWMAEYRRNRDFFKRRYFPEGVNPRTLDQVFESMAQGRSLPFGEARVFLDFVGGVVGNNIKALSRMFTANKVYPHYRLPGFFEAKDVDSGLFAQDFEEIGAEGFYDLEQGRSTAREIWVRACIRDWTNKWLRPYLSNACPEIADIENIVTDKAFAWL